MAGTSEENNVWSALMEPLSSFVGGQQENDAGKEAMEEDVYRNRYRKRILNLQMEVEEVNEEATNTRKELWEAQDKLKETGDQIRKLENHLNEILELREKDLQTIKALRVNNSDCVENESRAREAMEVFKKCYKRAQLKIKEHEEEIAVLREQKESAERGKDKMKVVNTASMVNESALEYIQTVSNDKEKRLKKMLSETENEVDLWKSKYKVANKRCLNWQEQILAMEHPSEGAEHIKRQRIEIDGLEKMVRTLEEKHAQEERDSRNPFNSMVTASYCSEEIRDGLTKSFMDSFQNLNCSVPTYEPKMPKMDGFKNINCSVPTYESTYMF
jgi:chromosome segregation ATPase